MSWADVAREVFSLRGRDPADVREITTEEYAAGPDRRSATAEQRAVDTRLIEATGFEPADAREALRDYVAQAPWR